MNDKNTIYNNDFNNTLVNETTFTSIQRVIN